MIVLLRLLVTLWAAVMAALDVLASALLHPLRAGRDRREQRRARVATSVLRAIQATENARKAKDR